MVIRLKDPTIGKEMKVLIADDAEMMRDRLVTLISGIEGIEIVGQAATCPETEELNKNLKPDVVLLDIRMPGGSGIEVLQNVKRNKRETKVIILTNYSYPQYKEKCLKLGANYFFDKSEDFKKIPDTLRLIIKSAGGG
jgi:DNA-binding NarL/FixJ family response regulator